jgi:hypothetical protein
MIVRLAGHGVGPREGAICREAGWQACAECGDGGLREDFRVDAEFVDAAIEEGIGRELAPAEETDGRVDGERGKRGACGGGAAAIDEEGSRSVADGDGEVHPCADRWCGSFEGTGILAVADRELQGARCGSGSQEKAFVASVAEVEDALPVAAAVPLDPCGDRAVVQ